MSLLDFEIVWQNFLRIVIIGAIFFIIYKSMREGRTKQAIRNVLSNINFRRDK